MSKRNSNWYVPKDWLWHLGMLVNLVCIPVLACMLLPIVARLRATDVGTLYGVGVGAGVVGILLLFIARLPLYRQRRFWTVGPRQLDRKRRRFYRLAYGSVTASLLLLLVVWLRTR
jgi:hypothetical protein